RLRAGHSSRTASRTPATSCVIAFNTSSDGMCAYPSTARSLTSTQGRGGRFLAQLAVRWEGRSLPRGGDLIQALQHLRGLKHATPPTLVYEAYDVCLEQVVERGVGRGNGNAQTRRSLLHREHRVPYQKPGKPARSGICPIFAKVLFPTLSESEEIFGNRDRLIARFHHSLRQKPTPWSPFAPQLDVRKRLVILLLRPQQRSREVERRVAFCGQHEWHEESSCSAITIVIGVDGLELSVSDRKLRENVERGLLVLARRVLQDASFQLVHAALHLGRRCRHECRIFDPRC